MNIKELLKPSLNWLLIFVPITFFLEFSGSDKHSLLFILACLSIIPLAGWLGHATEHIAEKTGEGIGGFLNATFGNAAELIIALMALNKGLHDVVKASLSGSIIGNILLVMGASFLAGGLKHKTQKFNASGARTLATMLMMASIALIIPAMFHYLVLGSNNAVRLENDLSLEISFVLLVIYGFSLLFSLRTHKHLFSEPKEIIETENTDHKTGTGWSMKKSIFVLATATGLIAYISEILVGSIEHAAKSFGMTSIFVGVIVVAIIGNAAEHSTAILVAMKNRMDLSIGIAIGSSVQIALFVAPVLVLASYFLGPTPMNLVFSPAELIAIIAGVAIISQIAGDGESNWLEGLQLLAVYLILGIVFYFLPEASNTNFNQH